MGGAPDFHPNSHPRRTLSPSVLRNYLIPGVTTQMEKLVGQHGLAQGNQDLIVDGNGTGTSAGAGPTPAGTIGEMADLRWTGTLKWQGTDTTRNERKEVHAQVTVTASKGNPYGRFPIVLLFIERLTFARPLRLATTWPSALLLAPAGPAVSLEELQDWITKTDPVITRVQPAPGVDDHNHGQLFRLLKEKNYVGHRCLIARLSRSTYLFE